ncbi:alkaline phosphatase family protein [Arachnia propionica]|uniref:alkaline phosphatase family protein n=1 Tax=Arachnia propionica TaxID=1750 RepID=UPI00242C5FE3|nr:alkaline phosphatase family protein [Arachnia propionica]
MKLLLIGLDGVRIDVAVPSVIPGNPAFAEPHHPGDPRFAAEPAPADRPEMPPTTSPAAPTLARLVAGGGIAPVWMTPPTDSGPGWSNLLTGTTHEQNNVWRNEFVGHRLAECPDVLSRIFFADPRARTYAAATWEALLGSFGPVIQRRIDQQRTGQHKLFVPHDFTRGCVSADIEVRSHACQVLNHEGPDAAFVYFEGVDEAGHRHGAASPGYRSAIGEVDEHVRALVKAVAERHEALGERWLVAVTTDHGHNPEGGHGGDEIDVRRSFLILHAFGAPVKLPARLLADGLPKALYSHEVTPLLLELLGVTGGSWRPEHEVGLAVDIPSVGPTGNPPFEW